MSNDNLQLWESVEKTDPAHTKKASIGGMKITAIDPQYQRKNATAAFGPYGIGWGIAPGSETLTFREIERTTVLFYQSTFFYLQDGKRGEFPITSSIKVAYMTNGQNAYMRVDDEALKKAQTDALTKGLSFLGFNADVFMGLFDDSRYVQQRQQEEQNKAWQAHISDLMTQLNAINDIAGLQRFWNRLNKDEHTALSAAKDQKKQQLQEAA